MLVLQAASLLHVQQLAELGRMRWDVCLERAEGWAVRTAQEGQSAAMEGNTGHLRAMQCSLPAVHRVQVL